MEFADLVIRNKGTDWTCTISTTPFLRDIKIIAFCASVIFYA